MAPLISVVTVVRNNVEGLITTARSVLGQDFRDIEYIVIDGGSTDETTIALAQFARFIDILLSEPDGGIYFAMNKAIERARGKWIHFLNCEDVFYQRDTLSLISSQLQDTDDIVFGQSFNTDTQAIHRFKPPHLFWSGMTFDHQAALVKSDIYKQLRYDTRFRINADFDFFSRARLNGYQFRELDLVFCRKPYQGGVSDNVIGRLKERFAIARRHFPDRPIADQLMFELAMTGS